MIMFKLADLLILTRYQKLVDFIKVFAQYTILGRRTLYNLYAHEHLSITDKRINGHSLTTYLPYAYVLFIIII